MTINELQDNVIEEFSVFDDWMDKYATKDAGFCGGRPLEQERGFG